MKGKPVLKLIVSEIAAVGTGVVPLALWFYEDYAVETIAVLFVLESVLAMILAVLCVLFLAPAEDSSIANKPKRKSRTLKDFTLVGGLATLIISAFPAAFIFLFGGGAGVVWADVRFGLAIVAAFQFFEFLANLYLLRPLSLKQSEVLLSYSFGGMALMLISMFLGGFLAVFFALSPFLPFIILKTLTDFAQPVRYFLGGSSSQTESLFDSVTVKTGSR